MTLSTCLTPSFKQFIKALNKIDLAETTMDTKGTHYILNVIA